jgi:glycosyltransferase involved in cell wall biosynthesis
MNYCHFISSPPFLSVVLAMKSARKRVLFLVPSLVGGGAERMMVTLLQRLDRARFELHLALVQAIGPYLPDVPADVVVHDLKARRVRYAFPGIIRLARTLRPQVVHTPIFEVNIAAILCRPFFPAGTRILIREDISTSAENLQLKRNQGAWSFPYRLYGKADKVICVADYVLEDLAENYGVPRSKMIKFYNLVDVSKTRCLAAATGNPYSGNGPHLVAAGRLSRQKGFDILLEAMALVRNEVRNSKLTILGEGDLRGELLAQRERLGLSEAVVLAGFQSNPFAYFKHADLFVLSSRFEGLPLSLLEAMAAGAPVVATDCPGGVGEILRDCPFAQLVQPSDPKALAQAIVSALDSTNRKLLPEEKFTAYLSRFDVNARVRDYEEILDA